MKEIRKKNVFFFLSMLLIACICIFVAIRYGELKKGFHVDEISTYMLSNGYYNAWPYEVNRWLTPDYYLDFLTPIKDERFALFSVFKNQAGDVHPPLYYIFVHGISSIFPGLFSKWIGIGINIVFISIVLFFIYLIGKKLTSNKWVGLVCALFYGSSIAALSTIVFIRMYALLALIQIVLVYLVMKYFGKFNNGKILVLIYFSIMAGGLTQYYFYVYAGPFIFFSMCILILKGNWKKSITLGLTSLFGVISALLIFPATYDQIFNGYRGEQVISNANSGLKIANILEYTDDIIRQIFSNNNLVFLLILLFIVLGICATILKNGGDLLNITWTKLEILLILLSIVTYVFIISQITPMTSERYIYPIYPLISILTIIGIYKVLIFFSLRKVISTFIILLFVVGINIFALKSIEPSYLYTDTERWGSITESYPGESVLVLSDSYFKLKAPVLEYKDFNEIYPSIYKKGKELPMDSKLSQLDTLILYLDKNLDSTFTRNLITEKYGFKNEKFLYESDYFKVYYLSR